MVEQICGEQYAVDGANFNQLVIFLRLETHAASAIEVEPRSLAPVNDNAQQAGGDRLAMRRPLGERVFDGVQFRLVELRRAARTSWRLAILVVIFVFGHAEIGRREALGRRRELQAGGQTREAVRVQRGVKAVDLYGVLPVGVGAVEREIANLFSERVKAGGDRAVRAPGSELLKAFAREFGMPARRVIGLKPLLAARAARHPEPVA